MKELTYSRAIEVAEHLIAIGQTEVYLYRASPDFPWDKVVRVEAGSSYRLSGPTSCRLIAEDHGLTFSWTVDFESTDANGTGTSKFDRELLRGLMVRLPIGARENFAHMLENIVLPPLQQRSAEILNAYNQQRDSEDCVRGLIAFARETQAGVREETQGADA